MTRGQAENTKTAEFGACPTCADKSGWLVSEDKDGMRRPCRGVADALGLQAVFKPVAPGFLFRQLAPFGPVDPKAGFGTAGRTFSPPWPDFVIATGRQSVPYLRAIKKVAGDDVFTVLLLDPKGGYGAADLIWVPEHDQLRGRNVITTLTTPHEFSAQKLEDLRTVTPKNVEALPHPRVLVSVGGPNKRYKYDDADLRRFARALNALKTAGASFMITSSRRTTAAMMKMVEDATKGAARILYTGGAPNPYAAFLAHADFIVVTADSANMCGEAAVTGRPIYLFTPQVDYPKFRRFHDGLKAHGAARELPEKVAKLVPWSYEPLYSAEPIALEIARRWAKRCTSKQK